MRMGRLKWKGGWNRDLCLHWMKRIRYGSNTGFTNWSGIPCFLQNSWIWWQKGKKTISRIASVWMQPMVRRIIVSEWYARIWIDSIVKLPPSVVVPPSSSAKYLHSKWQRIQSWRDPCVCFTKRDELLVSVRRKRWIQSDKSDSQLEASVTKSLMMPLMKDVRVRDHCEPQSVFH